MQKEFLVEYIRKRNSWWDTGKVEDSEKGIERKDYLEKIFQGLDLERIVCLSGIRRSGKSTLLFQLIDSLIKSGVKPEKIVYAKIDDMTGRMDDIRDIVNAYQEITGINPKSEKVFFILDEIHFLKNWQFQLKFFIDSKYKSKFIISGSSKTLLYKDASESLAGRIRFIDVFPLTFAEFAKFSGLETDIKGCILTAGSDFDAIKKNYHKLLPKKEDILFLLRQYLEAGGFPEWFKIKNLAVWRKTLAEDYLSLILFKDIVHAFKIKDPLLLEKLVRETALFSADRFSYLNLSNRLDADRETIKLYLYYLNSSMLIFTAEVYFKTKTARERLEKKIYFWEEGLRKAITPDKNGGKEVENVVAWHLIKKGFEDKPFFTPFYWKNSHEVDFVFEGKELIPVEIKYREQPNDIKGILEFMEKFKIKKGIVVTKDMLEKREISKKEIYFIPVWLFLLSLQ